VATFFPLPELTSKVDSPKVTHHGKGWSFSSSFQVNLPLRTWPYHRYPELHQPQEVEGPQHCALAMRPACAEGVWTFSPLTLIAASSGLHSII
jgi:hypothetical protein